MKQPAGASPGDLGTGPVAQRIFLAVVGVFVLLVLLAVVKVASLWDDFKRAGGPSVRSNISVLESSATNLRHFGFAGCPTVQQIMELTPEPARTDLRADTNGIDPWGTPYQVECDHDRVHVFSMGPDQRAGTPDDIRWKR